VKGMVKWIVVGAIVVASLLTFVTVYNLFQTTAERRGWRPLTEAEAKNVRSSLDVAGGTLAAAAGQENLSLSRAQASQALDPDGDGRTDAAAMRELVRAHHIGLVGARLERPDPWRVLRTPALVHLTRDPAPVGKDAFALPIEGRWVVFIGRAHDGKIQTIDPEGTGALFTTDDFAAHMSGAAFLPTGP
jgi:hypothetical protein